MSKNISYLLGAGASAASIPTVYDIKHRSKIDTCANLLQTRFSSSINWSDLASEILSSYSFDTLAKKYYVLGDARYEALKLFIQIYLIYEHLYEYTLDKGDKDKEKSYTYIDERYYPWILSLINDKQQFPTNIEILSWNYDIQIPLVMVDVLGKSFEDILTVYSPGAKGLLDMNFNGAPKYINGCATNSAKDIDMIYKVRSSVITGGSSKLSEIYPLFKEWIDLFESGDRSMISIQYSWDSKVGTLMANPLNILHQADSLVIIGYSLPLFNRVWDKQLIKRFINNAARPHSKSIYVQDKLPSPRMQSLKAMISTPKLGYIDFNEIDATDMFYVPFEFDPVY